MFFYRHLSEDQRLNLAHIGYCLKGVAHNINTPLSAVMGRAEMLQMRLERVRAAVSDPVAADELQKCERDVRIVLENSQRVSQIVRNSMRKSVHADQTERQAINLAELLQDEVEYLLADMQFKHDVERSLTLDPGMPVIYGDVVDFSNSFLELLDNSLRAMQHSPEKRLAVSCSLQNNVIEVQVRDSGRGIDAPLVPQVLRTLETGSAGDGVPADGGFMRVSRLLGSYQPRYALTSSPGATVLTIGIPVAVNSVA